MTPTTAYRIGEKKDDPLAMYKADLCTIPANLAGIAAGSGGQLMISPPPTPRATDSP